MKLVRLRCKDYGIQCDFEAEGDEGSKVLEYFASHTLFNHGN